MQYAMKLIEHEVRGSPVQQRASDGYISATAMCRIAGKLWADYARLSASKAFFFGCRDRYGNPHIGVDQEYKGRRPAAAGDMGASASSHPSCAMAVSRVLPSGEQVGF